MSKQRIGEKEVVRLTSDCLRGARIEQMEQKGGVRQMLRLKLNSRSRHGGKQLRMAGRWCGREGKAFLN